MNKILKFFITLSATLSLGLGIAYLALQHQEASSVERPIVQLPEPDERTKFLENALKDPASIEQKPDTKSQESLPFSGSAGEIIEASVNELIKVAGLSETKPLTGDQKAIRNQLNGFASLRTDSVRNPASPQNRQMMSILVQKRKARIEAREQAQLEALQENGG